MESLKSKAITGVKWSVVSTGYKALTSLLQIVILTRFIPKSDFGLMGIALLVNSFTTIFADMGLASAAMHELDLNRKKFSSFFWLNVSSGVLLTLVLMGVSPFIANYYHVEELKRIITFTSLLIALNATCSLQRTMQQKKLNFRFMSVVEVAYSTVTLVLTIFFATVTKSGVYSLVWAALLGKLVEVICYFYLEFTKEHNIIFHFSINEVKDALKIGLYQVGTSALDFFSREMDSIIVSSGFSLELFGVYTLCKQLSQKIYAVLNPIVTKVATPIFAENQKNIEVVSNNYKKVVQILGTTNFAIYTILAVASTSFLTVLYGESYAQYSYMLFFLCFYSAFLSCGNPVGGLLVALGRTDKSFYWTIFRIVFTSIYMFLASRLDIHIFVILIFIIPHITAYPGWYIMMKDTTSISFGENYRLSLDPFLICLPLLPLYFLDQQIAYPFLSIIILSAICIVTYCGLTYLFRRKVWHTLFDLLLSAINARKKDE